LTSPDFPDGVEGVDLGGGTWYTKRLRDGEWIGIHEWHQCRPDDWGAGAIAFDVPHNSGVRREQVWQVEQWEPLTLSPSLACQMCGHHGWIRDGRWVPC
jgi:hypothetical protein